MEGKARLAAGLLPNGNDGIALGGDFPGCLCLSISLNQVINYLVIIIIILYVLSARDTAPVSVSHGYPLFAWTFFFGDLRDLWGILPE